MRATSASGMRATLLLALLLALSFGCGPPSSQGDGTQSSPSGDVPELTDETIHERINEAWLRDIPEENGAGEPITWRFIGAEPKEITIVDKHVERDRATIVLDIKTTTTPRSRPQRYLAGQIRTEWELSSGWVLRQWEIVRTENVSMKYRNLPKPSEQNSNR